jgi:hypothetical protein
VQEQPELLAMSTAAAYTQSSKYEVNQVASFRFLPEARTAVCVTRGGDIATFAVDDEGAEVRRVYSIRLTGC